MTSDQCTNCGGQLPPIAPGQSFVQCHFCGHRAEIARPQEIPRIVIVRQPQARVVTPVTPVQSGAWRLFFLIPLLAAIGPIIAAISTASKSSSGLNAGGVGIAEGEDFQWSEAAPFIAKINGDAVEDFVGQYRVVRSGAKTQDFIGGFDGATLKRQWAAGPFSDDSDTRGLHFAVVANNLLVTDPRSVGHIIDVTSGKETASITLTDRAESICVEPTGKPEAWIHVSDNQDLDVDFVTKRTKKLARPPWCKSSSIDNIHCESGRFEKTNAACSDVDSSFKAPNFSGEKMLTDGNVSVVVGQKSPGTGIPTAVGYDPKAKRILWQRPIPQTDATHVSEGLGLVDMGGGRLVAQIELTTGIYKLVAIDAKSGGQLWETEIPRSKDGSEANQMLITSARVYLPHWTWLDIFDAKSGTVIGTVGKW